MDCGDRGRSSEVQSRQTCQPIRTLTEDAAYGKDHYAGRSRKIEAVRLVDVEYTSIMEKMNKLRSSNIHL